MIGLSTDFSKIRTKSYKTWRILQAPGIWAQIYRNREQTLRNYRSALIFPEQVLGLNQSEIYIVSSVRNNGIRSTNVGIRSLTNFKLVADQEVITTVDELSTWEQNNHSGDDCLRLYLNMRSSPLSPTHMAASNVFANSKDAIKFAQREIAAF